MKKLVSVLFVSLLVGGLVFAADPALTFSGYVNSGLQYDFGDAQDPGLLSAYARDADVPGYRVNLNGVYAADKVGAKFRLRATAAKVKIDAIGTEMASPFFYVPYAYVWAKLGTMAKVTAGIVDDGSYATSGDMGTDVGEGTGVLFQVMPVDGLSAGAAVYAKDYYGTGVEIADATYVFGASYEAKELVKVVGSFKYSAGDPNSALFGANILAVKNLGAAFELKLSNMATYSDTGLMAIAETFSYTMDALKVGLTAYEWLSQVSGADLGFKVNPWVSYTTGIYTPKLSVSYTSNEKAAATTDDTALNINPSVAIQLASSAKVVAGYSYTMVSENPSADNDEQQLYLDFVWSF